MYPRGPWLCRDAHRAKRRSAAARRACPAAPCCAARRSRRSAKPSQNCDFGTPVPGRASPAKNAPTAVQSSARRAACPSSASASRPPHFLWIHAAMSRPRCRGAPPAWRFTAAAAAGNRSPRGPCRQVGPARVEQPGGGGEIGRGTSDAGNSATSRPAPIPLRPASRQQRRPDARQVQSRTASRLEIVSSPPIGTSVTEPAAPRNRQRVRKSPRLNSTQPISRRSAGVPDAVRPHPLRAGADHVAHVEQLQADQIAVVAGPRRIARSTPSATRSSFASVSSRSNRSRGNAARSAGSSGTSLTWPKVIEAVSRRCPRRLAPGAAASSRRVQLVEQRADPREIARTRLGQRHPPRAALEQPHAEFVLQRRDALRETADGSAASARATAAKLPRRATATNSRKVSVSIRADFARRRCNRKPFCAGAAAIDWRQRNNRTGDFRWTSPIRPPSSPAPIAASAAPWCRPCSPPARGASMPPPATRHRSMSATTRVVPLRLDVTDAARVPPTRPRRRDVTLLINNAGVLPISAARWRGAGGGDRTRLRRQLLRPARMRAPRPDDRAQRRRRHRQPADHRGRSADAGPRRLQRLQGRSMVDDAVAACTSPRRGSR